MLRGASFALRKYAATSSDTRLFGATYAGSSPITPFFVGAVVGAIASGRVPAVEYGDRTGSWLNPTSMAGRCPPGVFLTADAARAGTSALAERLRKRTLGVGVLADLVVFAGLYPILSEAPTLSHGLLRPRPPLLIMAALSGGLTLILIYRRSYSIARVFAVTAVAAVVAGWGVGQYPWMLVGQSTILDAAAALATLTGLLVVIARAVVIVVPALTYLLRLTQTDGAECSRDTAVHPKKRRKTR